MDLFKEMIESRLGIKREVVGYVSRETLEYHKNFHDAMDIIIEQFETELEELKQRHKDEVRVLKKKYEDLIDMRECSFDEMWQMVYDELGIEDGKEREFEMDMRTGEITERIVPEEVKKRKERIESHLEQGLSYDEIIKAELFHNEDE